MDIEPEKNLELVKKCEAIVAEYPKKKSAAMMMMHLVQETFGHFDDSTIRFVASMLDVEPIEVYGMLSFYPMFTDKPHGRIHIKVCRTLSCAMAGSIKLANEISRLTNCPIGETRGVYTIEFVECLGNCVNAPTVQVNDKLFDNIHAEDAEKFLEKVALMDERGQLDPKPAGALPEGGTDMNSPAYKG